MSVAETVGDREAGGDRECDAAAAAKRNEAAATRRRPREGEERGIRNEVFVRNSRESMEGVFVRSEIEEKGNELN